MQPLVKQKSEGPWRIRDEEMDNLRAEGWRRKFTNGMLFHIGNWAEPNEPTGESRCWRFFHLEGCIGVGVLTPLSSDGLCASVLGGKYLGIRLVDRA